jgi:hypothetical protein
MKLFSGLVAFVACSVVTCTAFTHALSTMPIKIPESASSRSGCSTEETRLDKLFFVQANPECTCRVSNGHRGKMYKGVCVECGVR